MRKEEWNALDMKDPYDGMARAWISAPSIIRPEESFSCVVSILTLNGYPATCFTGKLVLDRNDGIENLPECLDFAPEDCGTKWFHDCIVSEEGIFRFRFQGEKGDFPVGISNPIWCRKNFPWQLAWGDIHIHTTHGKCGGVINKEPDFSYGMAKYVLGHEVCALGDHSYAMMTPESYQTNDSEAWRANMAVTNNWYKEGKFITLVGFEAGIEDPNERGGHFNFYFAGDTAPIINYKRTSPGTLEDMFAFARHNNALVISHHTGRGNGRGRNFANSFWGGSDIEPVMEICSQWGSSEMVDSTRPFVAEGRSIEPNHFYRYAIANGYKLGIIGGSDAHASTPGGFAPMIYASRNGKTTFPYQGTVGAYFVKDLSRASLVESIRARRCYAASLEKILVWTEAEGAPMGSEITARKAELDITVAAANNPIVEVVIIKNGHQAARFAVGGDDTGYKDEGMFFRQKWKDPEPLSGENSYYVRALQFDGELAWSSPIWVRPE